MNDFVDALGERGRALWDQLQGVYEFDLHEENLLLEVCRVLDVIDGLAESVVQHGVMVEGSTGQLVVNPSVGEMRQQQASFARLLPLLNLDDGDAASVLSLTQSRAKRAAKARWDRVAKNA